MAATYFFWDPIEDNIVREYDQNNATIAEYTTEPELHGNVISQRRQGQYSQFHYDGQGSTVAVTDANQSVTDTLAYSAFGEITERTGTTVLPFQYIGQKGYYRDSLTGDYLARTRPYEPETGRWLCEDMIGGLLRLVNDYLYANNSPTMAIDPSGQFPAPAITACSAKVGACSYGKIHASKVFHVGPMGPVFGADVSKAEGVGIAIGFIAQLEECAKCCKRLDFIQIYHERLSDPPGPDRLYQFVVDTSRQDWPWYGGTAIHTDPNYTRGHPDRIDEWFPFDIAQHFRHWPYTIAIFDRPYTPKISLCADFPVPPLGPKAVYHAYFESCVVCDTGEELMPLGCISWGFDRTATPATFRNPNNPALPPCRDFGAPAPFGPTCLGGPSIAYHLAILGGIIQGDFPPTF